MKKLSVVVFALFITIFCSFLTGCGETKPEKEIGPEVGAWHVEYKVSDIDDSQMATEDKLLLSMLAGNIMFEVDAEFCEDGTFTYTLNTDEVEEAVSNAVSSIASYFIDIDISIFTDRLVEAAFQDILSGEKTDYAGTYTKTDDGFITATDEYNLYFKVTANKLIQVDEQGNEVIALKKVSSQSE